MSSGTTTPGRTHKIYTAKRMGSFEGITRGRHEPVPGDVTLRCGHVAAFPKPLPKTGDVVYCRTCDDYSSV